MENCSSISFVVCFLLLMKHSHSRTIVVDGLSNLNKPTVHVGDSITFKYVHNFFSLYIFRNRTAFELCDFSQAALLNNGSSQNYTWQPSRMGFFYFSLNNGSAGTSCKQGEKASIRVLQDLVQGNFSFPPSLAPSPIPGGGFPSTPAYHWPFHSATASSPRALPPASNPSVMPDAGSGIPFINSNPAVPLPTGETDSATIQSSPTSGSRDHAVFWWILQMQTALILAWFA